MTVRRTVSCASLTCAVSFYLSTSLSLSLSQWAHCQCASILFIHKTRDFPACILCVICSLRFARRNAQPKKIWGKKKEKKTRNLFSFYANQITHKQQFLLRRWPLLLFGLLSSVFNLNSVWQTNLPTISACCLPASSLLEPFN